MPIILSEETKQLIQSNLYFCRYISCENVLRENNIPTSVSQLRRVFCLIKAKNDSQPSQDEKVKFKKAIIELEKYIQSFKTNNKTQNFKSINKQELNELFLDECFDYTNLTHDKLVKFFKNGVDLNYKDQTSGLKPFHFASKSDFIDINLEFLKKGKLFYEKYLLTKSCFF
jgi:hypothetical protein